MLKSITPPQADGVCKGIILSLPPHPTPLPRERELAETPAQADGVLKTLIKPVQCLYFTFYPIAKCEIGNSAVDYAPEDLDEELEGSPGSIIG